MNQKEFCMFCERWPLFGLIGALFVAPVVHAVPFTPDLSIAGSVGFDTGYAASWLSGSGTQGGSFRLVQGGVTASSAFSGSMVSGANPLLGTLTDLGDGFGVTGSSSMTNANLGGGFGLGVDFGLDLTNNSATDTYQVNFAIDFANAVDSSGVDAYARSNFYVADPGGGPDLFFSDITSDTVYGNIGGAGTGGPVSDVGPAGFSVILSAGQTVVFDPNLYDLSWTATGSAQPGSLASSSLDTFVSVASVDRLTAVPEPATLALFGVGLGGLLWTGRRVSPERSGRRTLR